MLGWNGFLFGSVWWLQHVVQMWGLGCNLILTGWQCLEFEFLSGAANIESSWLVCWVVLIILATVEIASNPWPIGACFTVAGMRHALSLNTAQKAGLAWWLESHCSTHAVVLRPAEKEESARLMDWYVQKAQLQLGGQKAQLPLPGILVPVYTTATAPHCPTQANLAFFTNLLFACSQSDVTCVWHQRCISSAFIHFLHHTFCIVTVLGRLLWSFKNDLFIVLNATWEQQEEHRIQNHINWLESQLCGY